MRRCTFKLQARTCECAQDELRDELEDAKYLFGDVELTEKEKADLR